MDNKKIGILTWHQYNNFGSRLQAAALAEAVSNLGYYVKIINYRKEKNCNKCGKMLRQSIGAVMDLLPYTFMPEKRYSYLRFQEKYLPETRIVKKNELRDLASTFDIILFGSDQIWAPNVLDTVYMGDFIDGNTVKKVSYAASIGLNEIPKHLVPKYVELLSDFSSISVRESTGKSILSQIGIKNVEVVLDPTLLLNRNRYLKMAKTMNKFPRDYIFCYLLSSQKYYKDTILKYANEKKMTVFGVSDNQGDAEWMNILEGVGPREFLWLINNAAVVFTDSYHGTIFSLVFHKDFYTFERFSEDDPINQNSRIYQLDNLFGISKRFIKKSNNEELDNFSKIDYSLFDVIHDSERKKSFEYLKKALG